MVNIAIFSLMLYNVNELCYKIVIYQGGRYEENKIE